MPPLLRYVDRPFIMPIVDKYKDMGTVVLGKVEAGEARKGQTLLVLPNKVLSSTLHHFVCVTFQLFVFPDRFRHRW